MVCAVIAQIDRNYVLTRPGKAASRTISYIFFEGRPRTTRGRWINPLVFANLALAKRLPQLRRVKNPIFIVGSGRSGTTVLGLALSMHRDVAYLNEPKALWHTVFPYEDILGNYTSDKARYHLSETDVTDKMIRDARRLYGAYLTATWSRRIVDKYPELIFRIPFITAIFPDARFLLVVRNGWDTCASVAQWSERYGEVIDGIRHDWWGTDRGKWNLLRDEVIPADPAFDAYRDIVRGLDKPYDMAAVEWIATMREGLRRAEADPERVLTVRYEDLTEKPRQILSGISEFAKLRSDPRFLTYGERLFRSPVEHGQPEINPELHKLFLDTMKALGY